MGERLLKIKSFDRFRKKLNFTEAHLQKVLETAKAFYDTILKAFDGDNVGYKEAIRKLNLNERIGDEIHEKLVLDLMESDLEPTDREDLLELSKLLDLISDWLRDGGRMLNIFIDEIDKLPKDFKKNILKMAKTLEDEIKILKNCLELLKESTKERAIKSTLRVSEIEQLIDQLNLYNLTFLKKLKNVPIASIILIRDFIDSIEQAADFTKDSSDLIRAIAIKKI
jgi:predicted phosphate transport protein (TIGR00153 family)